MSELAFVQTWDFCWELFLQLQPVSMLQNDKKEPEEGVNPAYAFSLPLKCCSRFAVESMEKKLTIAKSQLHQ